MVDTANAITANQTLIKWLPKMKTMAELLSATIEAKAPEPTTDAPAKVCVAFQIRKKVTWNTENADLAGRTFEEAFAYDNMAWCQDLKQRSLHLRVVTRNRPRTLAEVTEGIHRRVKGNSFKKTDFALALMMAKTDEWEVPAYIAEGLQWLSKRVATIEELAPVSPATEAEALNDAAH